MNKPRDPKDRYIKSKSDLSTKVPSNLFGGRNVPITSFIDQYQKTRAISTQRGKVVSEVTKSESTIEQKIEPSVILGQEERPLEPFAEPNNTTFVFLPPSRDPKFEDIIDPEQVNTLFGSSTNIIVSQIDTENFTPITSTGSSRDLDTQTVGRPSHQRDTLFSSR
jgi:hypothetical protein